MAGIERDSSSEFDPEEPASVITTMAAPQAHPEFRSRPHRAHPLFAGLVEAGLARRSAAESAERTTRLVEAAGL